MQILKSKAGGVMNNSYSELEKAFIDVKTRELHSIRSKVLDRSKKLISDEIKVL